MSHSNTVVSSRARHGTGCSQSQVINSPSPPHGGWRSESMRGGWVGGGGGLDCVLVATTVP